MKQKSLFVLFLLLLNFSVFAHDMGDGAHITTIFTDNPEPNSSPLVNWTLEITLQELLSEYPEYDMDENGRLTPIEYGVINARTVAEYVQKHIRVFADQAACHLSIESFNIITHKRADFLQFPLLVNCDKAAGRLHIEYNLFFNENPYHQGTWTVIYNNQPSIYYFWEDERQRSFTIREQSWIDVARDFLGKGLHHIVIGYDHVLFLVSLLLTVVLIRRDHQWQGVASSKAALWNIAKIVTAFTLAHSLTLTLAVLKIVPLPSAYWVEIVIAFSVFIMALNNIKPLFRAVHWITFGFGLIHGFGFANVLLEYELPTSALVTSLISFNLGVELGQLLIALVLFVPLYRYRNTTIYSQFVMPGVSLMVMAVAIIWIAQRSSLITF